MFRLIVNADDLGSSAARDRGIFAAFQTGIVTSASLLANGPSFTAAARETLTCALPVGVHLNLSEGAALTGPIPGLTDTAGHFPGKAALRRLLAGAVIDAAGVRRELLAQIERVRVAGLEPDHLDTHQHCLLFPALTGLVADLAEHCGIRALRLPVAPPVAATAPLELADELTLYRQLAPAMRLTLGARNLWTPDGLWGMELLNRLDSDTLCDTLTQIPPGTWELMTHPGHRDPADPFGGPQREIELAALTAPATRALISARGIELTSFGACACAC